MRELQYPVGEFEPPTTITTGHINGWIDEIESLPATLSDAVAALVGARMARSDPGTKGWSKAR